MKTIIMNRKGSALVSVIVVIAFISILATTMLYISGTNYQLKMADNKIKVSFYDAEEPVDIVRADVVRMVSDVSKDLYPVMLSRMANNSDESGAKLAYQNAFYDAIEPKLQTYVAGLDSNIYNHSEAGVVVPPITVVRDPSGENITIKGIIVKKKDANTGYTSIIKTDIVVQVPDMDWPYDLSPMSAGTPEADAGQNVNYFKSVYYSNWVKE